MTATDDPLALFNELVRFHHVYGTAEALFRLHVDDGRGRCAGCAWPNKAQPTWPCLLADSARVACEQGAQVDAAMPGGPFPVRSVRSRAGRPRNPTTGPLPGR